MAHCFVLSSLQLATIPILATLKSSARIVRLFPKASSTLVREVREHVRIQPLLIQVAQS